MIKHALIQFKPYKAQLEKNKAQLIALFKALKDEGVDVITLPETCLSGYFLEAGVREEALSATEVSVLLQDCLNAASWTQPVDICLGFYERFNDDFFNSALYAEFNTTQAGIKHVHRKVFLPTYGVFDEARFVSRGKELNAFHTRFGQAGILICEDAWHTSSAAILALKGADILYIPTASPARDLNSNAPGNAERWRATSVGIAAEHGVFVLTTCLVGFEGGKGFSGYSSIVDPYGSVIAEAPLFHEHVVITDVHLEAIQVARYENPLLSDLQANLADLQQAFAETNGRVKA